jgi:site-specific recombinase XerD
MVLMYQRKIDLKNTDHIFTKEPDYKPITVQAVNKLCKKYFSSILGKEFGELAHPHTFRHSRAVQLLNTGVNIVQAKTILGHSNIMNTLVYLKYSNNDIQESIRRSNEMIGIK